MKLVATFLPQAIRTSVSPSSADVSLGTPVIKEYVDTDPYEGTCEVTPSANVQTLHTENKRVLHNITINPIPPNYGLITWNGSILTVS